MNVSSNNIPTTTITATLQLYSNNTVFAVFYDVEGVTPGISVFQIFLKVQDQIPTVLAREPKTLRQEPAPPPDSRATLDRQFTSLPQFPHLSRRMKKPLPRMFVVESRQRVQLAVSGPLGYKMSSRLILQSSRLRVGKISPSLPQSRRGSRLRWNPATEVVGRFETRPLPPPARCS